MTIDNFQGIKEIQEIHMKEKVLIKDIKIILQIKTDMRKRTIIRIPIEALKSKNDIEIFN